MGDVAWAALFIGAFGLAGLSTWLKFRRDMVQKDMLFQVQKQLLAQCGSGADVAAFLASREGREFFDRLGSVPKPPPERPKPSPLDVAAFLMLSGLVGIAVGAFFIVVGVYFQPGTQSTEVGLLCLFVGMALFASSRINYLLFRRWGWIPEPASGASESKTS